MEDVFGGEVGEGGEEGGEGGEEEDVEGAGDGFRGWLDGDGGGLCLDADGVVPGDGFGEEEGTEREAEGFDAVGGNVSVGG